MYETFTPLMGLLPHMGHLPLPHHQYFCMGILSHTPLATYPTSPRVLSLIVVVLTQRKNNSSSSWIFLEIIRSFEGHLKVILRSNIHNSMKIMFIPLLQFIFGLGVKKLSKIA